MSSISLPFDGESTTKDKLAGWTTAQLHDGLRSMFSPPSHAILFEVPDATGLTKARTCDALIMSLWPSRGLSLIGAEIKSSRSDWVKERDDPSKAESIARYCDAWYLVVGSREIVGPGELPDAWGLIAPKGDKLRVIKEAATNGTPEPIGRKFLAALFRRAVETSDQVDPIRIARQEGELAGFEKGRKHEAVVAPHELARYRNSYEALKRAVDEFEAASGVQINQWSGGKRIGEAVKILTAGAGPDAAGRMAASIEREAKAVAEAAVRLRRAAEMAKGETTS